MALSNVKFVLGQGGLGRPLPGSDYISGLAFYTSTLPSGFTTANRVKQFFSIQDAEAAGVLNDYSDETAATFTYLVTAAGALNDKVTILFNEPFGKVVTLGVYTRASTDTTVNLVATGIAAAINLNTITTGYSAVAATATVTTTVRKGLGLFSNTGTPVTVTIAGAITGTLTQPTGGVGSKLAVYHYHIAEYFRMQPQGNLFVGFFAVPGTYTFSEILTLQTFAVGQIRQYGVYKDSAAFATADMTAMDIINKQLIDGHKELVSLYAADLTATTDLSTLTNLGLLTANTVSAVIAQDGAAQGATLALTYGKSITTLGATLGAVSLAKVSESIAWVQKFNISNGTECDTIAFANGQLLSNALITDNLLTQLDNYGYIFLRKFVGVAGSYFNSERTAITPTSDYTNISDNRTIQKATRGLYAAFVPQLNSPLTLNSDGTLLDTTIAYFIGLGETPLQQMESDTEISASQIQINTTQNVLSSSTLYISVAIVQIGTARNIVVNIGYALSIS